MFDHAEQERMRALAAQMAGQPGPAPTAPALPEGHTALHALRQASGALAQTLAAAQAGDAKAARRVKGLTRAVDQALAQAQRAAAQLQQPPAEQPQQPAAPKVKPSKRGRKAKRRSNLKS